jgi:hypothetical protein
MFTVQLLPVTAAFSVPEKSFARSDSAEYNYCTVYSVPAGHLAYCASAGHLAYCAPAGHLAYCAEGHRGGRGA